MFVEAPMLVSMPPHRMARLMGISDLDAAVLVRFARPGSSGSIMTSTGGSPRNWSGNQ